MLYGGIWQFYNSRLVGGAPLLQNLTVSTVIITYL